MRKLAVVVLQSSLFVLAALAAAPLRAAVIEVAPAAVGFAHDGNCSLAEAIVNANRDLVVREDCPAGNGADVIRLAPGSTYELFEALDTTYGPTGLPLITEHLEIDGRGATIRRRLVGGEGGCSLNGIAEPSELRLLAADEGVDLTLQGLELWDGCADGPGAAAGGGVLAFHRLALRRVAVVGCAAREMGGGISFGLDAADAGALTVVDSTLDGNHSDAEGGGISVHEGTLTVVATYFNGNRSEGEGGALHSVVPTQLSESTVNENYADVGGDAMLLGGDAILRNVTIRSEGTRESTLLVRLASVDVDAATVVESSLVVEQGTLRLRGVVVVDGVCEAGPSGTLVATGTNLETGTSCGAAAGGHFTTVDAETLALSSLHDNGGPTPTLLPGPTSPMIDGAPDCLDLDGAPIAFDQRGTPRPSGGGCDLGAVEVAAESTIFAESFEPGDLWPWSEAVPAPLP